MNSNKLKTFILVFIFMSAISTAVYCSLNRTVPIEYTGNQLVKTASSSNYLIDEEIIITGKIKEQLFNNRKYALVLEGGEEKEILCDFKIDQTDVLSHTSINQCVKIKGVYKGELSGLIILNCTLLETTCND